MDRKLFRRIVAAAHSLTPPLTRLSVECHYEAMSFMRIVCASRNLRTCVRMRVVT